MAIEVWRGPVSTGLITRQDDARISSRQYDEYVKISFSTGGPERGSSFVLYIEPSSFDDLAAAMIKADQDRAVKAFGKAQASIKLT